ncbi:MAG: IseA DL-endopeptidase inhibitor family protein [Ruminococcus sp.]|jgi:hypothetical protein|nr:IseA DL-endopeptidase inhibitor family protein [Ruminococcus sp.]
MRKLNLILCAVLLLSLSSCNKPKTDIYDTAPTTFAMILSTDATAATTATTALADNSLRPFEIPHMNDTDYYAKYVPSEDFLTAEQTEVMERFVLWQLFDIDPLPQIGGLGGEAANDPIPTGVDYAGFYEYLSDTFSSDYADKITGGEHPQYVNKNGELCIAAGMGGINPAFMKSAAVLSARTDSEITFSVLIYEDADDGTGSLKLSEYQPTVIMIKENGKWVIDSFEVWF